MINFQKLAPTNSISRTFLVCLCLFLTPSMKAIAADDNPVLSQYLYTPASDALARVKASLAQAEHEDKLALVVLGAQWCHDSVGLSQRFSTDEMQSILSPRYVTQFVDVGYLEDRRDITTLLGYPNYFATPTVLIVEPKSKRILNIDTITVWQSADSVDLQTYIEQFSKWNAADIKQNELDTKQNELISQFEQAQSERLQNGYKVLGPLLAASDAQDRSEISQAQREQFLTLWREVKRFRTAMQASIHELKTREMTQSDLKNKILETTLPLQSWEKIINKP